VNDAVPLLHDYLIRSAQRLPEKVGLVCGALRVTYAEILVQARKLGCALRRRGIGRGDRVLVLAENSFETVIAFWGVLEASAVVVLVNPLTKNDKLLWLLNDCRASAVIINARRAGVLLPVASRAQYLRALLVTGPVTADAIAALPGVVTFDAAIAAEADVDPPPRDCTDGDLAALIYTSGSTGEPKGVMLTHSNMLNAAASICQYLDLREDDVVLNFLPMAFDYGLYQMLMSVRQGARLILERSFQLPMQVVTHAASEQVSFFPGVPTIFAVLAQLGDVSSLLSSVRAVTSTGAPFPVGLINKVTRMFPNARIFSMYGLTECKRCTYLPPEDLARKPQSVGIAIPNTELWLVDEHDRRVGPGGVGQLVIRGATVMRGYWEKPEETAKSLRSGPLPGERVLYTGDYCRLDDDGYLYFVGRMDDIIKSRGEKVPPNEVESALYAVPGVKEVAVIGVPDEVLGQAVVAFVVLEDGATFSENDLRRECLNRLESFMVPKSIKFRRFLPRSSNGKVRKTDLA
jgi:amino acid adenylation domain-containing protein